MVKMDMHNDGKCRVMFTMKSNIDDAEKKLLSEIKYNGGDKQMMASIKSFMAGRRVEMEKEKRRVKNEQDNLGYTALKTKADKLIERCTKLSKQIIDATARTPEGLAAKVRLMSHEIYDGDPDLQPALAISIAIDAQNIIGGTISRPFKI